MNRMEHIGTIAAEECAEIAQRISKALRFGFTETQPGQPLDNAERIRREYVDLVASLGMLEREAGLHVGDLTLIRAGEIPAKQDQIERFLIYSGKVGTLND